MQCPYCAETIKDGAILCLHCKQNFAPMKPLLDRITALDAELATVRAEHAAAVLALDGHPALSTRPAPTWWGIALASCVVAVLSYKVMYATVADAIMGRDSLAARYYYAIAAITLWGVPFGFGAWLGTRATNRPARYYLWYALPWTLAVLYSPVMGIMKGRVPDGDSVLFLGLACTVEVTPLTGAWFVTWLRRRRSGTVAPSPAATRLAARLLGNPQAASPKAIMQAEQLGKFLTALQPLLTVLTAGITAWFGYLAAVGKPPSP